MNQPEPRAGDRIVEAGLQTVIQEFDDDLGTRIAGGGYVSIADFDRDDKGVWRRRPGTEPPPFEFSIEPAEGAAEDATVRIAVSPAPGASRPLADFMHPGSTLRAVDGVEYVILHSKQVTKRNSDPRAVTDYTVHHVYLARPVEKGGKR